MPRLILFFFFFLKTPFVFNLIWVAFTYLSEVVSNPLEIGFLLCHVYLCPFMSECLPRVCGLLALKACAIISCTT